MHLLTNLQPLYLAPVLNLEATQLLPHAQSNLIPSLSSMGLNKMPPEIIVTNPVTRDISNDVIAQKSRFAGQITLPEGTKYFAFFDPEFTNTTYIAASSKTTYYQSRSDAVAVDYDQEFRKGLFDKVAQRELSVQTGIFKNPDYRDVSEIFHSNEIKRKFILRPMMFVDFPIDEIIELNSQPRSYIFHNTTDGFRVRTSSKGGFTISSKSELVRCADRETKHIKDPRQRLESFLGKLIQKNYTLEAVGHIHPNEHEQQAVINGVLDHSSNVYIKDARTGGGYLVVRVRTDAEVPQVESDSPEFITIANRSKSIQRLSQRFITNPPVYSEREESAEVLRGVFMTLRNPMIEEEIPYLKVDGARAELRFICQRVPRSIITDEDFEIHGYVKVSSNKVSANISLGGTAAEVKPILAKMYEQILSEHDAIRIKTRVELELQDLNNRVKAFAEVLYKHYTSIPNFHSSEDVSVRDFAIDLVPIWDEKSQKIDFAFLEINYKYGYTGLVAVNKSAAKQVSDNKQSIASI